MGSSKEELNDQSNDSIEKQKLIDIEAAKGNLKDDSNQRYKAVVSNLCYAVASIGMTLNNKFIFVSLGFKYPVLVVLWQNIVTVILLLLMRWSQFVKFNDLRWDMVKKWVPVNILFIFMLVTGSFALQFLSVPMVTIFKNTSTVATAIGDYVFFGQKLTKPVLISSFLIVVSSIVAGSHDLQFNLVGYIVMLANVFASTSYLLYMRYVMSKDEDAKSFFDQWTLSYYNNAISLPFLAIQSYAEFQLYLSNFQDYNYAQFYLFMIISGVNGLLISVCSLWTISVTSPTTFAIVGALNKIPLTILGFLLFDVQITFSGGLSIGLALVAGFLFTFSKIFYK